MGTAFSVFPLAAKATESPSPNDPPELIVPTGHGCPTPAANKGAEVHPPRTWPKTPDCPLKNAGWYTTNLGYTNLLSHGCLPYITLRLKGSAAVSALVA